MADTQRITRRQILASMTCSLAALPIAVDDAMAGDLEPAPHFVARTLDGERLTSDSLKGKVVLIEFWATWCTYCKKDEAAVENIVRDFSSDGLVVLAVDMGEPKRKVKKYLDASPRSCKIVLAEDTTLAAICNAQSYPLYVLIDREGNIAGRQNGSAGERALRRFLTRAGLTAGQT